MDLPLQANQATYFKGVMQQKSKSLFLTPEDLKEQN